MSTQHRAASAALVIAAREGDTQAQDALATAYLPLVYNIVGRALNGSVDVDDVVQETMLRALHGLDGLRTPERFRSWLVAVAMNQVRTHWQDRQNATGAVDEAQDLADPGADFVDLTVIQLQLSGQRQETACATRWLEPDDRGLLSLWWLECVGELSRAEVAAALDLSTQHTAVRVQRMKAQLEAARVVVRALVARPQCEELRVVLASWDGLPSALWRKRIARHARECVRCSGLWSGLIPAEGLLAGMALVGVSSALLASVRSASGAMTAAGSATLLGESAATSPSQGRAASRTESLRRRRMRRRAVSAAIVAACLVASGLWYFGTDNGDGAGGTTAERAEISPMVDLSAPSPEKSSPSASKSKKPHAPKSPSPTLKKTASAPRRSTPLARVPAGTPQSQPALSDAVGQVVALVNEERAAAGCGPLTEDSQLEEAAQNHSDDMAARGFFDHINPDGADPGQRITATGYRWSTEGENIAKGQVTATSVMESWMNSPGHRANILNCSFKNIGVGVHKGAGGPWWTQDFGNRM